MQPSGWLGTCFKEGILRPLSWGYSTAVALRNIAFEQQWLKVHRPASPHIISIGNIAAGGSGKTPMAVMLAESLLPYGRVALLSRGYRASLSARSPLLVSNGQGPRFSAQGCGDEPYLLAERLPGALVIIGRDRVAAAHYAARLGAKVIILDDGFQHRWLGRDSDVVVLDAQMPALLQGLLPRGLMREKLSALARARLVVVNHIDNDIHYAYLADEIKRYTDAPCVGTAMEVVQICGPRVTVDRSLCGVPVAIFCGIANPSSFERTVASLGADIVLQRHFGDHASFTASTLVDLAQQARARGAQWLMCTEKDAVKVRSLNLALPLPLVWVKMQLRIVAGQHYWDRWHEDIRDHLAARTVGH
jgi:tetraacyldisaccharide 4'-kinase